MFGPLGLSMLFHASIHRDALGFRIFATSERERARVPCNREVSSLATFVAPPAGRLHAIDPIRCNEQPIDHLWQ
jgi:hypothetical protein